MNAVGIDVSKGKSTVAVLRPFGEVVASPFDVIHNDSDLKQLVDLIKRKGGKDILRFPIKGDDSVNRVNNSVVELSGKYSLSNDR